MRSLSMVVLLLFINTYRMLVFFLLAGFFTALLLYHKGEEAMLKNRYQRIVVPFLLFLPVLALIMTILRIIAQHVMITGELGFDVDLISDPEILWNNTHNLWFLYYLALHIATVWLILKLWPTIPSVWRMRLHSAVIAIALYRWHMPAEIKFLVVCTGTLVICMVSYQLFVRNSRIGEILNGRRYETVPWQQ